MDYSNLPKKRMDSGCLLFNNKQQVLLVKPNYKEAWEIPGGIEEDNESPKQCCIREDKEELSINLSKLQLLVVDYNQYPELKEKTESLMFIFDGGTIDEEDIQLDMADHEGFIFVGREQIQSNQTTSVS